MLVYLKIEDLALVESVEIEFGPGFNVLTGETGAGKTVLVGAIGLLLGERSDVTQVRQGAREAVLSCSFDLQGADEIRGRLVELGMLEDDETELMLLRSISAGGKSRSFVNGKLCPVGTLGEIGDLLVDIHGQNTHQALLKPSAHLEYLDRFAGTGHTDLLSEYSSSFARLRDLEKERDRISSASGEAGREVELLRSEIAELSLAEPGPDELETLEADAARLRNARELSEGADRVRRTLISGDGPVTGVRELLLQAAGDVKKMSAKDPSLATLAERLESSAYEAEDISANVIEYLQSLDGDPSRLDEIESRITVLRTLARKYGGSVSSAMEYLEEAGERLAAIESDLARLGEIDGEIVRVRTEAARIAAALSAGRRDAAGVLEGSVSAHMRELELADAVFAVRVKTEQGDLRSTGCDTVEFLFSPDRKAGMQPLRKIASGGEMSRVMLAIKIALAGSDRKPVLVFDEIDAGIGGETAVRIGEKLSSLARYHQVFCVTHLHQIASFADRHYAVFKKAVKGGGSSTGASVLDEEGIVEEICRMMGDSGGSRVTVEHAKEILERARAGKAAGV